MYFVNILLVLGPAVLLLAIGFLPSRCMDQYQTRVRRMISWLAGMQCLCALVALLSTLAPMLFGAASQPFHDNWPESSLIAASVHYDGFSSLMLLLVSFLGMVVCQYSMRYLDGDARQGRYFRWIGMTIGAVSLLVISGNLLMFFAAWVLTSVGLHQLLLHYPDRSAARRAAWTKFVIRRVGDCFLVAAIVLVFLEFGTFKFDQLFSEAAAASSSVMAAIAWLSVLGAVTKSAQFPGHTWLPENMETPTSISALMHAGIVNAGGYLVIRLSPLIVQAPAALMALAMIGTTAPASPLR